MNMQRYALESSAHAKEIAQLLTDDEVKILAKEMLEMGLAEWARWQVDNQKLIVDFVASTPAQRAKKKQWRDPDLKRKLVLASIVHCVSAHELLSFYNQHEYVFQTGGSYRDTTALAGSAYFEIRYTDVPDWPECFEEICDSPF